MKHFDGWFWCQCTLTLLPVTALSAGSFRNGSPVTPRSSLSLDDQSLRTWEALFLKRLHAGGSNESYAPAMSVTTECVSILAAQYFIVYSLVAIIRLAGQVGPSKSEKLKKVQQVMLKVEHVVNIAPMLCVLFLAGTMQALDFSEGSVSLPFWVQMCMRCATFAAFVQVLLVVIVPLGSLVVGTEVKDVKVPDVEEHLMLVTAPSASTQVVGYALMLLLYGSCAGVCVGIVAMQGVPLAGRGMAPAVSCTLNLTLQYFVVHFLLTTVRVFDAARYFVRSSEASGGSAPASGGNASQAAQRERRRWTPPASKAFLVLKLAAKTMFFAPMLCVLFVGARVRAYQVGARNGDPQPWAQWCFYACTYAVLAQTILSVVIPLIPGGDTRIRTELTEGELEFKINDASLATQVGLYVLQYIPSFLIYGCCTAIVASIFTIQSPEGPTPKVSPAVCCMSLLTAQFFAVYVVLWVAILFKDILHGAAHKETGSRLDTLVETLYTARAAVHFSPMLAILFVGLRMKAQLLTAQKGTPPGWAQDAMYACTAVLLLQMVVVLGLGVAHNSAPSVAIDGLPLEKGQAHSTAWILCAQLLSQVVMYGGIATVIVAFFTITPETATGNSAIHKIVS